MLEKQNRSEGYQNGPVALKGRQENLTPGVDPNIKNGPEGVGDDGDWNLDGFTVGESTQSVGMKPKLRDSQNEGRIYKEKVLKKLPMRLN